MSFLARLVQHFASEAITARLARSKTFQDLALKTHQHVQKGKGAINDPKLQAELLREATKAAKVVSKAQVAAKASSLSQSWSRFRRALGEEIRKDLK